MEGPTPFDATLGASGLLRVNFHRRNTGSSFNLPPGKHRYFDATASKSKVIARGAFAVGLRISLGAVAFEPAPMPRSRTNPRNKRQGEVHTRALHALSHMYRGLSRAEACRLEHIKEATFMRHVGSAVRQNKPGGRFHAAKGDRFRRDLNIPTALGPTAIPVYGIRDARKVSKYLNAVGTYLRTGNETKLRQFKGKTLKIRGRTIDLITDPATLTALAEADALHLDQLYATATGRS